MLSKKLQLGSFFVFSALFCISFRFCESESLTRGNRLHNGIQFTLGSCLASTFYARQRECMRTFYGGIRENGSRILNCSVKYSALRRCVSDVYEGCLSSFPYAVLIRDEKNTALNNFLTFFGTERRWCREGGLSVPTHVYRGTFCHPIYRHISRSCVTNYQSAFNSRTSIEILCSEHQKAKTCLLGSFVKHCWVPSRSLKQMIEQEISEQFLFQPFCSSFSQAREHSYEDLLKQQECPPKAHADIMFLIDASSGTSDAEFQSMKSVVANVARRMDYGDTGVRIAVVQFHAKATVTSRMNRFTTNEAFLQGLNRTRRIRTRPNSPRLTGKLLNFLARNQLNIGQASSVVRSLHTRVIIMMTTGASNDSMLQARAITLLKSKNVFLIRLGPTLRRQQSLHDNTYRITDTTNFTARTSAILRELCKADRLHRTSSGVLRVVEAPVSGRSRHFLFNSLTSYWIPARLQSTLSPVTTTTSYGSETNPSSFNTALLEDSDPTEDTFFNIGERLR